MADINRRSFIKRTGLLSGLAVLNPLRVLGFFKPDSALSMETIDGVNKIVTFESRLYGGKVLGNKITKISYWNGKQWIPVED